MLAVLAMLLHVHAAGAEADVGAGAGADAGVALPVGAGAVGAASVGAGASAGPAVEHWQLHCAGVACMLASRLSMPAQLAGSCIPNK